ncbi:MAG: MoxR family ATPase [Cryobacterium sp.]|nr:MoxR family ATPase [Oligoflexia bacterium]
MKLSEDHSESPLTSTDSVLVGRVTELRQIKACLATNRSVLLEGPVGVGKTHLAIAATAALGREVFRIDGDGRYTEQKLTGWFDPPTVMKEGFTSNAFIEGPLLSAMRRGGVLFINELNRLPEGVQNVLLPALDEKMISLPKIGTVRADPRFTVIATQNPREFVATSHLSEAILDRFELISIGYQNEREEIAVVESRLNKTDRSGQTHPDLARTSVRLVRGTRTHPRIRRGASIRAALAIADLTTAFLETGSDFDAAFLEATLMALPTRIEWEQDSSSDESRDSESKRIISEMVKSAISSSDDSPSSENDEKKKH